MTWRVWITPPQDLGIHLHGAYVLHMRRVFVYAIKFLLVCRLLTSMFLSSRRLPPGKVWSRIKNIIMLAHQVGPKSVCVPTTDPVPRWGYATISLLMYCIVAVWKKTLDGIVFQTEPVVDMVQFGKPRTKSTISLSFGFRFGPIPTIKSRLIFSQLE